MIYDSHSLARDQQIKISTFTRILQWILSSTQRNILQVIRTLVYPQDVKIIESIPLSRIQTAYRDGWHFTHIVRYQLNMDIK